jgi:hypothetical protein
MAMYYFLRRGVEVSITLAALAALIAVWWMRARRTEPKGWPGAGAQ